MKNIDPFNADQITMDNFEGFMRVRKKPIIIRALQMNFSEGFTVTTMAGEVTGASGDYLMFGVKGEKYPCRKDIFEATYDVLDDSEPDDPAPEQLMVDYTEIRDEAIRKKICELMSEMLDNPDEYDIYPTSRFMWKMESYILELIKERIAKE